MVFNSRTRLYPRRQRQDPRRQRRGRPAAGLNVGAGLLEFCQEHLDALWVLARLSVADGVTAEHAVIEAVVASRSELSATDGPPAMWSILSGHIGRVTATYPRLWPEASGLSRRQLETVALVAAGRTARRTAALTGAPLAQVHNDLRAGLEELRRSLGGLDERAKPS